MKLRWVWRTLEAAVEQLYIANAYHAGDETGAPLGKTLAEVCQEIVGVIFIWRVAIHVY